MMKQVILAFSANRYEMAIEEANNWLEEHPSQKVVQISTCMVDSPNLLSYTITLLCEETLV